jgi:NAD(P)-dependent dehydrogenase (short-subunit alcohol dehydrogenase family)
MAVGARPLNGKRILFAGALDERGGAGVVARLLAAGAQVVVASADAEALATLAASSDRPQAKTPPALEAMAANFGDAGGIEALLRRLRGGAPLDAVVANLGGPSHGPKCTEAGSGDLDAMSQGLKAHVLMARAFMPLLARRPGSLYLLLNDSAALDPKPASGIAAAAAAGQLMLARSLSLEAHAAPVVHSLVVTPGATLAGGQDEWLTPENVGEAVVELVAHPEAARGDVVLNGAWRQQLTPGAAGEAVTYL